MRKNGCRVEAPQLGAIERIERALPLFLIVALRIVHLMYMGRSCPDLDAELFFDVDEIRGAYLLTDVRQPARPKLNEVLRLIARVGGFVGRKGDGEPGAKANWPGLKEFVSLPGHCRRYVPAVTLEIVYKPMR